MKALAGSGKLAAPAIMFLVANITVKMSYAGGVLLLASILPPDDYAGYGLLYALQTAATTLSVTGLVEITAGRLRHYADSDRHKLFERVTGLFAVTALATFAIVLPVIASVFWPKGYGAPALSATVLGVIMGLGSLQANFHRIDERHMLSLVSSAGLPLASLAGVLCAALWLPQLWIIFALASVLALLVVAALFILGKVPFFHLPDRRELAHSLREIAPFGVVGAFGWLGGYGMSFVIEWRFAPLAVASYTFLYTVAALGQVVANSMNMVWSPRFYRLFNAGEIALAETQSRRFFSIEAGLLGLAGLAAVAALPIVCNLIGGHLQTYGQYRWELAALLASYVFSIPAWHAQNYYMVSGAGRELMIVSIWAAVIGFAVWIGGIMMLGEVAIYFGFALQAGLRSAILWASARSRWPVTAPWAAILLASGLPFLALALPD
jgi:O-antigen/teichoic acid export membrane protein